MAIQLPRDFQGVIRIENRPAAEPAADAAVAPAEPSTFDKIKKCVAPLITIVGLTLLAISLGMLISCSSLGFCAVDVNAAESVFMCGLGAMLAGFTLQNGDHKGELQISDARLPFKYTLK